MDHKRQLYETGADEQGILNALGLRRCNLTLLEAYRCSPYIVQVAASFVGDPVEREAFVRQHPPVKTARQTPLLCLASNADDEREHLIEMVRNRIDKNDRMAILFPTKRHVYGYARALQEAGLEVEVPGKARRKGSSNSKGKKAGKPTKTASAPEFRTLEQEKQITIKLGEDLLSGVASTAEDRIAVVEQGPADAGEILSDLF
jgi:hypothetical protein